LKLNPLEIFFNHETFAEVAKFFIPKKIPKNLDDLSVIFFFCLLIYLKFNEKKKGAAGSRFGQYAEETRMGLQHALEVHRVLQVDIDVDAPSIFVPEKLLFFFFFFKKKKINFFFEISFFK